MESTNSLAARDVRAVIHPFTNLAQHVIDGPMVITRGEGVFVFDDQGRRYLEGLAGLWCASLGFSEERLLRAAEAQMAKLPAYHLFGGKTYAPAVELAEQLLTMAPVPMSKVLFVNSGSEANDTALKLARYYHHAIGKPEKRKIIARTGSYHGVTLASASLTGLPHVHQGFGLPLQDVLHADCPRYYRHAFPDETEDQFATRLAEDLEHLILHEDPATVAAFIAEPVMGAGGVIIPPATYFEKVQRVLKAYGVLLIADEVITGFGRTGKMFGCETFGIEPDLITVAKALSGGYQPIGAVLIAAPIYQAMQQQAEQIGTFGHGFTCGGHPVSTAVALRALEIYREDDVLAHVGRVAQHFAARLQSLADHTLVGEARSVGLVGALELMADPGQKRPFTAEMRVGARVVARALELGVILRPIGDTISFCPPLIVEEAEIDLLFDAVHQALDDVAADLASEVQSQVA